MAITVGNSTKTEMTGSGQTFSHTSNGNGLLVAFEFDSAQSISSVTYAGVALTHIGGYSGTHDIDYWYTKTAAQGANNVIWSATGVLSTAVQAVSLIYAGDAGSPVAAEAQATSWSPSVTTRAGGMAFAAMYRDNSEDVTPAAGTTEVDEEDYTGDTMYLMYKEATGTSTQPSASWSSSLIYTGASLAIDPAPVGGNQVIWVGYERKFAEGLDRTIKGMRDVNRRPEWVTI